MQTLGNGGFNGGIPQSVEGQTMKVICVVKSEEVISCAEIFEFEFVV